MYSVVLFGTGSPVIVDIEESCARRDWRILAWIKNVDGPDYPAGAGAITRATAETRLSDPVLLPMFDPAHRARALDHARVLGAREFPVLIDPTSVLPRAIAIGEGSYINAGCTLGAAARIGRFVFINRGSGLGHHLVLGDFASIGPGVVMAGQVTVGRAALIGAGAVIGPGTTIGEGAMIAPGAVVRHDVPAGAKVAGNPARIVEPAGQAGSGPS